MTLLIKNVQILGGDREFKERLDVFVADDKIAAIGNFPNKSADEVLDGQEAYLSPGFIDVNTDSDHYLTLFEDPGQEDFLRQGVTTIMGGMCGASLAPLLYGTLESVRKWGGSENKINIDWHTMGEFLATLERRPLAVNFGTLVGHATIRRAIVGDALRDLTKNETNVFLETLARALREGGFGLSTGLGYVHARKTPYAELKTFVSALAGMKGIYATHLRKTGLGVAESVEETIKLAKETGSSMLINHFVPVHGAEGEYEKALGEIEALPAEQNFHFDLYPFDELLLPLYTFLPVWTQNGGLETMLANIKDDWLTDRIKKDMDPPAENDFLVAQAPGNEIFVGKSLRDIKEMYDLKDGHDALIKLMRATELRGTVLYKVLNMDLIRKALKSPHALVASNAPSFADAAGGKQIKSKRATSTFTKFLSMAEQEHLMPLADAVRKITYEPAKKFGFTNRGIIKEGNIADLACFKNGEIKFTVVGGKVAMKDGAFREKFPGKVLRRGAKN
ncbi:MAG TPA: amidohydrolase family protein [Candidatus Paceibacterota bacterium]|jgi:N-acyl-D-amino-acid deacylase|nr:amidohydrolase family protein [Candidatus Paceibacterota bacterium]